MSKRNSSSRKQKTSNIRDQVFWKFLFSSERIEVTKDEVAYFREHPDEINEFSAPLNVHKFFLVLGFLIGIALVGVSKILKYSSLLADFSEGLREFCFDIVFEIGVALIGAVATTYLLGILLNQQQRNVKFWRAELRRRINQKDNQP